MEESEICISSLKLVKSKLLVDIPVFTVSILLDSVVLKLGKCFTLNTESACIAVTADIIDNAKTVVNDIPKIVFEFIETF